jgi:hypothetical protein
MGPHIAICGGLFWSLFRFLLTPVPAARVLHIKEEKWPRIARITRIWRQDKVLENKIRAIRVIRGHSLKFLAIVVLSLQADALRVGRQHR